MSDLEKQLTASLPGRPTAILDYASARIARERLTIAIDQAMAAARETILVLGQRPAADRIGDAVLQLRQAAADLDIAIRRIPT